MTEEVALYNISQRIIQAKGELTKGHLVIGGLLSEVRSKELWEHDDYTLTPYIFFDIIGAWKSVVESAK